MSPAPPSFDSFPEVKPKVTAAPPSFDSFPTASTSSFSSRPTKRSKTSSSGSGFFLDDIERELRADGKQLDREDDSETRRRSGKSRESRDRSEDTRDSERRKEKKSKHSSSKSRKEEQEKGKIKYGERERDFGLPVKKPWQLVAAGADEVEENEIQRQISPPVAETPKFYFDQRGDNFNIRYGGLDRGSISKYRRLGAGRVVGFNTGLRITKETAYTGRGVEIGPLVQYRTPRYTDPRSAQHLYNKHYKRLEIINRRAAQVLGEDETTIETTSDPFLASSLDPTRFVPFESEVSMPENLAMLEFEDGQEYRSIAGLIKPSDLAEVSDEEGDDVFSGLGITGGESREQYLKRRNIELDKALRLSPKDVKMWLEFVDFQEEVAQLSFVGGSSKRALSAAERTSTSEIKLSILDRAIGVVGNEDSELLLLAYLRAASEVWDPKKVLSRWGETLRSHPKLTGLWIEYVSWRQTSWVNFGVREVVEVFEESFKVLTAAAEKETIGSAGREALEGNSIYLFLRCCLMLRQAGFTERALCAFQGLIELNFFRSEKDAVPARAESETQWRSRLMEGMESFWDSEVPRVGEPDAKGWCNSAEDSDLPEPPTPAPLPTSTLEHPFERWAATERNTAAAQPRPARTTDPGVDDDVDPFRIVLFDDIRDFLFVVHSPDSKTQLAYAFLTFLGLPFIPPEFPTSTPFSTDTFIHSELVERPLLRERFWPKEEVPEIPFETVQGEAMEPQRKSALKEPFDVPFRATPVSIDLLFGTKKKWFVTLGKDDLKHVDVDFARNTFALLRPVVPADGFFTLDSFALEASQSPKAAVKLAKQVLKLPENRQNLSLWDGYARIERQRGKIEEARTVYVTALSMYREFRKEDQVDGPLLWRAWAEMEWEEGRSMLALKILVAASFDQEMDLSALAKVEPDVRPSPAQILRSRQYYTNQLEAAFQPNTPQAILRNRNHIASSAALFEYLSQSLAPAVEVFERHLFRLDYAGAVGSAENEEAYMLYVKLLWRHAEKGVGYKPGQLREVLERAIKEYPNNSLFLSVYYSNELRMKIQNRVRRTLEESVLSEKIATSEGWIFAIFAELNLDARSHSVWGVRNLFDRAVENPRTRPSASLWTLYIDFEVRNRDYNRAKSLIYRALREVPWCKELYLKPFFSPLRSIYNSRELKEMHSLLLEKGLRVRVEIDDFIDGWTSDVEMDDREVEEEEQGALIKDTEELYSERQRLMPY